MKLASIAVVTSLLLAPVAGRAANLSKVYGAALGGDMARALAILDSIDVSQLSAKDSTARACLKRTFGNPPATENLPAQSGRIRKAREDEGRGFGQGLISEKSLDEVILAYLSEDADEK